MIEHVIAQRLLDTAAVKEYCNGKVFALSSPAGTFAPYVVVRTDDTHNDDDVIASFDITIEIYDYNEDKRPLRQVSKAVKDALNWWTFQDPEGVYSNIRVRFAGREQVREKESTLSMMFMRFTARASENITT